MLIAFRNYADDGTLSGGSWSGSLPLANLQDRQPSIVARSTSAAAANTIVNCDFGEARTISFVALLKHNLTQQGQWRVRLSNDAAFATSLYDSGQIDIWPTVYPFGVGLWGEFVWGGKLTTAEAATYGINAYRVLAASVFARYLRIELFDTANAAGYLQAGRLIAAPAWQPSINLQYGWQIEQVDESRKTRSRGGQTYVDIVPKARRLSFALASLEEDEMWGYAYELDRQKGVGGDILVMVDPAKTTHLHRQTVYGTLAQTSPIANPAFARFDKAFAVEELL